MGWLAVCCAGVLQCAKHLRRWRYVPVLGPGFGLMQVASKSCALSKTLLNALRGYDGAKSL